MQHSQAGAIVFAAAVEGHSAAAKLLAYYGAGADFFSGGVAVHEPSAERQARVHTLLRKYLEKG